MVAMTTSEQNWQTVVSSMGMLAQAVYQVSIHLAYNFHAVGCGL